MVGTPTDTGRSFTFTGTAAQRAIAREREDRKPSVTPNLSELMLEVVLAIGYQRSAPGEGTGGTECTSQRVGKNRRCQRVCLNRRRVCRYAGSVGFYPPRAVRYVLYPCTPQVPKPKPKPKHRHGRGGGGMGGYLPPQGPSYLRPKLVGGVWQFFPRSKKLLGGKPVTFFFLLAAGEIFGSWGVYTPPSQGSLPPPTEKNVPMSA